MVEGTDCVLNLGNLAGTLSTSSNLTSYNPNKEKESKIRSHFGELLAIRESRVRLQAGVVQYIDPFQLVTADVRREILKRWSRVSEGAYASCQAEPNLSKTVQEGSSGS